MGRNDHRAGPWLPLFAVLTMAVAAPLLPQDPAAGAAATRPQPSISATPVVTPTPVATPSPVPTRRALMPPFSLFDCRNQLRQALALLTPGGAAGERVPADMGARRHAYDIASQVSVYLEFRDDLHTSLANYTWEALGDGRVQNDLGTVDLDTIEFPNNVGRISALSFETQVGDVFLHRVRVYDENGLLRQGGEPLTPPRLLQHGLPRRYVFHLWRRTTISRIEMEYSRATPNQDPPPRVIVWGGVTEKKEHIKTALFHLNSARQSLQSGEVDEARKSLLEADQYIAEFIRNNQAD